MKHARKSETLITMRGFITDYIVFYFCVPYFGIVRNDSTLQCERNKA